MTRMVDKMAGIRTQLANERTFMACLRTTLAMGGAGLALIHVFEHILVFISGWVLCLTAACIFGGGAQELPAGAQDRG